MATKQIVSKILRIHVLDEIVPVVEVLMGLEASIVANSEPF